MKFLRIWLHPCDAYAAGCRLEEEAFDAVDAMEADAATHEWLRGCTDLSDIEDLMVIRADAVIRIDVDAEDRRRRRLADEAARPAKEAAERAEYERLRAKFGGES